MSLLQQIISTGRASLNSVYSFWQDFKVGEKMNKSTNASLKKVYLSSDVFAICIQHALTTEKEEIMGLLIGEVDEDNAIAHISACVILHRSDKQPDRVEISPEQLCTVSMRAEELAKKLDKPMRVLGWYHSHPHITVCPSHVDLRTQAMYQTMDPTFVGLIYSVYPSEKSSTENEIQLTAFQTLCTVPEPKSKPIPIIIKRSPFQSYNLESIIELPQILVQEELQNHEENGIDDELSTIHNEAIKTIALVHIVSKVSQPMCDNLEARLLATRNRIEELKMQKQQLLEGAV